MMASYIACSGYCQLVKVKSHYSYWNKIKYDNNS